MSKEALPMFFSSLLFAQIIWIFRQEKNVICNFIYLSLCQQIFIPSMLCKRENHPKIIQNCHNYFSFDPNLDGTKMFPNSTRSQPTSQRISPRHRFNQRHPIPRRHPNLHIFAASFFVALSPLSCTLINFYRIFHTFRSSIFIFPRRRRSHAEKKELRKFSIFFRAGTF
uniref:(northern house mosquito) hypothetical protein n=1 Tax=Culex pipiens TaxID=7175 RepID=A0A8D8JSZ5_CULPI